MQRKRRAFWVTRLLAPLIAVTLLIVLVGHLQALADYVRLFNYKAPSAVASLADQDTMTPYARKLFYVNHPVIASKSSFGSYCGNQDEQTIILGCYHPIDHGIFVDKIIDPRLNGVQQVTAAHEMLHAAYDRLSSAEKKTVDAELQDFYAHDLHDQRIQEVIASYQKTEPGDVVNEMHSVFGTEVSDLSPALKAYYSRYFTNQPAVVQFANAYQDEFTSREDKVKADDAQLKQLKKQIDDNTATLHQEQSAITAMQQQMDDEKNSGDINAYNSNVPGYNAKIDDYNSLVHTVQSEIADYNQLVSERNSLVLEVRQLTQSITSQPSPIGQ